MSIQLVQTVTVGSGGASAINFNTIPQDATDLLILAALRDSSTSNGNDVNLTFNGSTTGYEFLALYGSGTARGRAGAGANSNLLVFTSQSNNLTANTFSNISFYIPNYTASHNKTAIADGATENNSTASNNSYMSLNTNLWANTAAISSMSLFVSGATLLQNSTASLYKITKA